MNAVEMLEVIRYAEMFKMETDKIIFNEDSIDYDGNLTIHLEDYRDYSNNKIISFFNSVKPICSEFSEDCSIKFNYYQLPFKFNKVNGNFIIFDDLIHYNFCSETRELNCLIDMTMMPRYVNGNFESRVLFKFFRNYPVVISKKFSADFMEWDETITTKKIFKSKFNDTFKTGKGSIIYDFKRSKLYKFYIYDYVNRKKFFSDFANPL